MAVLRDLVMSLRRRCAGVLVLVLGTALAVSGVGFVQPAAAATPTSTLLLAAVTPAHAFNITALVKVKRRFFVGAGRQIWVLNPNGKIHKRIKGLNSVAALAVSPKGDRVYASSSGSIFVIDTHRLKVLHRFQVKTCFIPALQPNPSVEAAPNVVLIDGRIFYVSGARCQTVKSIGAETRGHALGTGIQAKQGPLLLAGGGHTIVVSDSYSDIPRTVISSYRVKGSRVTRQATETEDYSTVAGLTSDAQGRTVYVRRCCVAQVQAFPTSTLEHPVTYTASNSNVLNAVAVSPNGRSLAMGISDSDVDVVKFQVGRTSPVSYASTNQTGPKRPVGDSGTLTYSEDGKNLFYLLSEPAGPRGRDSLLYLATSRA